MLRFPFSAPTWGRYLLRVGAAIGVALLIAGGLSINVARAGADVCASTVTPAPFIHTATSANTFGSYTLLDETAVPLRACDIAGVFVTPDWNPSGNLAAAFDTHQVGVWYDSSAADWAIANEDGAAMPIGASFNAPH